MALPSSQPVPGILRGWTVAREYPLSDSGAQAVTLTSCDRLRR